MAAQQIGEDRFKRFSYYCFMYNQAFGITRYSEGWGDDYRWRFLPDPPMNWRGTPMIWRG